MMARLMLRLLPLALLFALFGAALLPSTSVGAIGPVPLSSTSGHQWVDCSASPTCAEVANSQELWGPGTWAMMSRRCCSIQTAPGRGTR